MEIPEIQKIINQKAEKRARKEIDDLIKALKSNKILNDLLDDYYVTKKDNDKSIKSIKNTFLYIGSNDITLELVEKLTEKYIPEETKIFVNKIEEFERQLDELKNSYEND